MFTRTSSFQPTRLLISHSVIHDQPTPAIATPIPPRVMVETANINSSENTCQVRQSLPLGHQCSDLSNSSVKVTALSITVIGVACICLSVIKVIVLFLSAVSPTLSDQVRWSPPRIPRSPDYLVYQAVSSSLPEVI